MTDVDLRLQLLLRAKEILMQDWEHRIKVEESLALYEARNIRPVRQPTLGRIMATAEKLYRFVVETPKAKPEKSSEASEDRPLETDSDLENLNPDSADPVDEEGDEETQEDVEDSETPSEE